MKAKIALAVASLSMVMATPALAADSSMAPQMAPSAKALSSADQAALFASSDTPVQAETLSESEMKGTEGAFVPLLVRVGGGAVIGGGAAIGHHFYNGGSFSNISWGNVGYAAGVGAVGGAWGRYLKMAGY